MEMTSIQSLTELPFSRNRPTATARTATIPTDAARDNPSWACSASTGASNRFIRLVMAANTTAANKMTAKMLPKGISWKTWASVMNRSGGPEDTSSPKANTAGTTTQAATSPGDGIENGDVLGGVHHVHISLEVTTVDECAAPGKR